VTARVRAVFLWHLHQPEYRDPQTGRPLLPWVRLHACRSYTDMAAALEKHPGVRFVVNWAPSLLLQLEAYVRGEAVDRDEELARRPASSYSTGERAHVLKESFSVNWELWVKTQPRYAELLARRGEDLRRVDLLQIQESFSDQDLRDLQVQFWLGWMGFAARREEPLVAQLLAKQRGFTEEEKLGLLDAQRRIAARVLPRWRALRERGQVELTCSPLFHPILPLLIDSDSARRAMPLAQLPPRFAYPEDARLHVTRALDLCERVFGARPVGMWPSEGSVSPEAVELFAACGVKWIATDQGNLEKSELAPDADRSAPLHVRPWSAGAPQQPLTVLFRDREVSDLIGFRYAKSPPFDAAKNLVDRVAAAPGAAPLVTVALDGENPWEHYEASGELFLEELYGRLEAPGCPLRCVLPRDELPGHPARDRITRIHSGSWIESNFRIWIGHPEDNAAWALLGDARRALAEAEKAGTATPAQLAAALEAILPAEGSDWFWWYGDDFTTDNAAEFDALFRRRLQACWQALGQVPPERLGRPIIPPAKDSTQAQAVLQQPRRLIAPGIDGVTRGFYEWHGAGIYRPGRALGGSMHQGGARYVQLWFGFSATHLFLRLDPDGPTAPEGVLELVFSRQGAEGPQRFTFAVRPGAEACALVDAAGQQRGLGRSGAIVELSLELSALGLGPQDKVGLLVRVLHDEVEQERLPRYGDLPLTVPGRGFDQLNWQV
jgi:alpha-amylase/alpha-mannosidase (GH57 family)